MSNIKLDNYISIMVNLETIIKPYAVASVLDFQVNISKQHGTKTLQNP